MASRNTERREPVTRGTGNVFADLGFPDAAERQAKLRLAYALNQVLDGRKLSQADAAKVLGMTQPKVSALRHYKLVGFSVERLMNLLTALDQDVEIVIRRKPRSRKAGRIVSHREFERLRGKRLHFRDAYRRFLKTHSLQDIGVDDEFADSARDRTTGRKVLL